MVLLGPWATCLALVGLLKGEGEVASWKEKKDGGEGGGGFRGPLLSTLLLGLHAPFAVYVGVGGFEIRLM